MEVKFFVQIDETAEDNSDHSPKPIPDDELSDGGGSEGDLGEEAPDPLPYPENAIYQNHRNPPLRRRTFLHYTVEGE
jgi:hypothetical protein